MSETYAPELVILVYIPTLEEVAEMLIFIDVINSTKLRFWLWHAQEKSNPLQGRNSKLEITTGFINENNEIPL